MGSTDFYVDYDIEVSTFGDDLKQEAEDRLLALANGHTDIVGAAISAAEPAQGAAQPFIFEVRVVVYTRPTDIVAVKQSDTLQGALKAALSAVERQVREKRDKLGKPWERSDISGTPGSDDDVIS